MEALLGQRPDAVVVEMGVPAYRPRGATAYLATNGSSRRSTYSNPAWEWYAGMGLRLTRSTRIDGEAFYHGATLGRDVTDSSGLTLRETVDLDGVGVRVGLDIAY